MTERNEWPEWPLHILERIKAADADRKAIREEMRQQQRGLQADIKEMAAELNKQGIELARATVILQGIADMSRKQDHIIETNSNVYTKLASLEAKTKYTSWLLGVVLTALIGIVIAVITGVITP